MITHRIEISPKTIMLVIGTLLGLYIVYQIRSTLVLLLISFLIMTAFNPVVRFLGRYKVPVIIVMFVLYFGVITLVSTIIATLVPALVQQTVGLTQSFPDYLHNLESIFNTQFDPSVINNYLTTIPSNLLKMVAGIFGNLLDIMAVFFVSYYLVLERPNLHKYLVHFFPSDKAESRAENLVAQIELRVGGWVRGELILMLIIGILTYIGLVALGVPYALPLAILAGILELIPNIGPTIAAIPAILLGLTISPWTGLGTLIISIAIQQLENNLIVPQVMRSATDTAPLVTILVLLVGFTLGGIAGAILSIPLFLITQAIIKEVI